MKILAGLPTFDGRRLNQEAVTHLQARGVTTVAVTSSLLTHSFNKCLAEALNRRARGVTHFLLLHADVVPLGEDWLNDLFGVALMHDAKVLSVVLPIKDESGLTSTALDTDPWRPRRLSTAEMLDRPPTWTAPDLLVNSGFLLLDIRGPWIEQTYFTINDRLHCEDGRWVADVEPEDWGFSRQCQALGVDVWVTREISARHDRWTNDVPYGALIGSEVTV